MEVKDIFELRKQGKIEEAYEAIRPMYAAHQGHYTTIAMFWCASDMIKLRLEQQKVEEALKIFQALIRLYPNMDDADGKGHHAILRHAISLSEASTHDSSAMSIANSKPTQQQRWDYDAHPSSKRRSSIAATT